MPDENAQAKADAAKEEAATGESALEATRAAAAEGQTDVGEAKVEEKKEEGKEEEKGEEEKTDEVTLPDLTDEQRAALAKDPAIQEAVRGEGAAELDAFIKNTIEEHDQKKETEQTRAAERKTKEEALKVYREDNDPAPLAQIAAEEAAKAETADALSAEVGEAMTRELRPYVEAVYGETIKGMKPEEVKELAEMPLVDALQKLDDRRVAAIKGESAGEVDAAKKAAQNAKTAADARGDGGGNLPGGSAEEAVGDDIGTLMRKGLEDGAPEYEEVAGG